MGRKSKEVLYGELMGHLLLTRALCSFPRTSQVSCLCMLRELLVGVLQSQSRTDSKCCCDFYVDQTGKAWSMLWDDVSPQTVEPRIRRRERWNDRLCMVS